MYKHAAWLPAALLCAVAGCSGDNSDLDHASAPLTADLETGARIYSGYCVACHQEDARGIPEVYPSLAGSPVVLGDPKELALWVIKGVRPASLPPGRYPTNMRQFGWMKAQDAAALFTYLRSHFGNAGSAVDAAAIEQALGDGE
jgi:mono/diheme cytochrome c family protein